MSNCYYYIDDVSVEVIDKQYFIEPAHENCRTCTRCAQGHPYLAFPNVVDQHSPFFATAIDHARVVSLQVFDRHGSKLFHRWFGDHNCWPPNVDNLPGYYPGWDFRNGNNYYPNDQYKVVATAWNCCADGSNNSKFERVFSVSKTGHPTYYDYIRYDYSWFPSPCCLDEIVLAHKILKGRPEYIVSERIEVNNCLVDQFSFPTHVYLQAPEINLLGETIVYDPSIPNFQSILTGGFTAIAAPCTPTPALYGCTPVPSISGKNHSSNSAYIVSNSYWATAPPQVPVYYLTEGPEGHPASRSVAAEPFTGLSVYPNPADQELHITLPAGTRQAIGEYRFRILDSQGRELPPAARTDRHPTATLGIAHLAAGFYVLEVSFGVSRHYVRFVKS